MKHPLGTIFFFFKLKIQFNGCGCWDDLFIHLPSFIFALLTSDRESWKFLKAIEVLAFTTKINKIKFK